MRERAHGRCEYCLKPDFVTRFGHQIDHIISLKLGGDSVISNLAYACLKCNGSKGSNVAAYDESKTLVPLYHPRQHNWSDHFELQGALMVGKTSIGRITINVLDMNHPKQVEIRQELMQANQ